MSKIKELIQKIQQVPTLISELDVKATTPLTSGKVEDSIKKYITLAQDLRVKKNLGRKLYNKLLAEWQANSQDLSQLPDGTPSGTAPQVLGDATNYQELYKEVYPVLCWFSYCHAITPSAYKITESGVIKSSNVDVEVVELEELKKVINEGLAVARQYTAYLVEYIEETFKGNEDAKEASKEGQPHTQIYTSRKPHHRNPNNYDC